MNRKLISVFLVLFVCLVAVVHWLQIEEPYGVNPSDAESAIAESHSSRQQQTKAGSQSPEKSEQSQATSSAWVPAAVFRKVGAPAPQIPFPRGEHASRRYHEVVRREIDPQLAVQAPSVLAKLPQDGRLELLPEEMDEYTKAAVRLVFDPSALDQVVQGQTSRVLVPTTGEEVLTLEFETIRTRSANTHTLQGHLVGEEGTSTAQLVYHDGIIHGNVMRYDTSQEIEYRIMSDGHMMVRKIDTESLSKQVCGTCLHGEPHSHAAMEADFEAQLSFDDGSTPVFETQEEPVTRDTIGWRTVDVTVGYDLEARILYSSFGYNGYSGIEARIIASVDRMNQAFVNSQITDTEIVLLGTIEDPDYVFPGSGNDLGDELTNLRNEDDGPLDAVTAFNNQLGGDLVTFVLKSGYAGVAGIANSMTPYAVVSAGSMTASEFVYAHELGHNLNAQHAWGDTGLNENSNTGWRFQVYDEVEQKWKKYRTIMAYDGGWQKIPYYSNPNVPYLGVPTGAVDGYDASSDPNVDPRLVVGGYDILNNLDDNVTGFDGSVPTRGANNARTIDTGYGDVRGGATAAAAYATRSDFVVISPAASAQWEKGSTQTIQFNGGDMQDLATIELYKGGSLHSTLATDVNPAINRNFEWAVPFSLTDGTDYMIRVVMNRNGGTLTADSDLFEIFSNLPRVNAAATTAEPQGLGPVTELILTFNVPMDPSTFDAGSDIVSFTDPVGISVASLITGTSWSDGDTVLTIDFTPPSQPGTYEMVIGPDIEDVLGNPMDQDLDGTAGESVEDRHTVHIEINPPLAYYANMDVNPNWTFSANNPAYGWEFGQPTGGTGPSDGSSYATQYGIADPTSGYNGPNVIGYNLDGDYERGISETRWATTPAMDCSSHENLKLRFQRWLGVYYGGGNGDNVYIEVSNDGVNWTQKYYNGNQRVVQAAWVEVEYDISDVADRQETVYIRWGMGRTNSSSNDDSCGWNIDEVIVFGDYADTSDVTPPDPSPMAFATPPTAQGTDTITMTAVTATDYNGVEYFFDETSGSPGGTDSEWQDSPIYTDTGLTAGTQYTYTVKARDKSANRVETSPSSAVSVSTAAGNTVPVVDAGLSQSVSIAPANLWTPANTSIARWYDAADVSSITASGGSVSQWNDKSGNDNHATQTTSSNRPVSGTQTIGGKNVIDFDKDSKQSLNIPLIDVIGKEVWSVFALENTSAGSQLILGGGGNVQVGVDSATGKLRLWSSGSPGPYAADTKSTAVVLTATPTFAGWLAHTDTKKFSVNGTLQDTGDVYNDGKVMNATYIGQGQYANYNGTIGEVVITNGVLSLADRELMEGYLAHRWGLAASLPTGHTHKYLAPGGAKVDVILNGTITDVDGQIPSVTWSKLSGPGNVSFANAAAVDTTASFIEPGTYVLQLTADDGTHQVSNEVTITVSDQQSFAGWISGYSVGGLTAPGDDFDKDGIPNAIENYFGSNPGTYNAGLSVGQVTTGGSTTFEFSHPISSTPASDLTATYRWSKDLSTFYNNGQSDPAGTTVTFAVGSPVDGEVTVTATITGTEPTGLFVDVKVTQE